MLSETDDLKKNTYQVKYGCKKLKSDQQEQEQQ